MKRILSSKAWIVAGAICAGSCVYDELPTSIDCTMSDLAISLVSKQDATSCKSIDGNITMSATGGSGPYDFSLGDGIYQTNPVFDRLAPGSYSVTVKDVKGCKQSLQVDVGAAGSDLTAAVVTTGDTECLSDNGIIAVTPTGGKPPYLIKIGDGTFGSATTFSNLKGGNHTIIIKDFEDCQRVLIAHVDQGNTGISYSGTIFPIFQASCNFSGCHGVGSSGRDWTKFEDVKAKASDIKSRTSNRSMPIGNNGPALTDQQIQQIACWVDDGAINN